MRWYRFGRRQQRYVPRLCAGIRLEKLREPKKAIIRAIFKPNIFQIHNITGIPKWSSNLKLRRSFFFYLRRYAECTENPKCFEAWSILLGIKSSYRKQVVFTKCFLRPFSFSSPRNVNRIACLLKCCLIKPQHYSDAFLFCFF